MILTNHFTPDILCDKISVIKSCSDSIFFESLILAQDERWRRG